MPLLQNKLILGTANFGRSYGISKKVVKKKEINKITKNFKSKIEFIDTALKYRIPKNKINLIKNFKIITKINFENRSNIKSIIEKKIIESLKNFKAKSFEAILLHDTRILNKHNTNSVEYVQILEKLKRNKLCKNIGVSIYDPNELKIVLKYFKPDIIQAPLNIFDQRLIKSTWFKYLLKNNIKIHIRSIFLKKILLIDSKELPKYFYKWKKIFYKYEDFCKSNNLLKIEACLNFVLQFKHVKGIVIGVDNIKQLDEITKIKKIKNKYIMSQLNSFSLNNKKIIDPRAWKL